MTQQSYEVTQNGGVPIKSWTRGVPFEDQARQQLVNISRMPFIHQWVAAMPYSGPPSFQHQASKGRDSLREMRHE